MVTLTGRLSHHLLPRRVPGLVRVIAEKVGIGVDVHGLVVALGEEQVTDSAVEARAAAMRAGQLLSGFLRQDRWH